MPKCVAKTRLARAIRGLAAFRHRVDEHGIRHLLPLLALKQAGVRAGVEAQFEAQDDFRFWDRFFLVDPQSHTGRYYDPFAGALCIASHPHSNVATERKGAFAHTWHAAAYRTHFGRTYWTLADDYLRRVRERALTRGGTTTRVSALDLIAWLRRHDAFPDEATVPDLLARFAQEFNLVPQEFGALFEAAPEMNAAFFGAEPVTPADVLRLIEEHAAEAGGSATVERFSVDPAALRPGLAVAEGVIEQAAAALAGGSHLVLAGPPGIGKSTLAEMLAACAARSYYASGYLTATAAADWTPFETIGGYMPARTGNELDFHEGLVLRAIREDSWCIIDELNRANMDRAIGALLTLLAGSEQTAIVELPYRQVVGHGADQRLEPVRIRRDVAQARSGQDPDSGDYVIGRNWRLIATMNTLDRTNLFTLSAALARRFATVYVGLPPAAAALDAVGVPPGPARRVFNVLMAEADGAWTNPHPLGPAFVKDAWRYVEHRLAGPSPSPIRPEQGRGSDVDQESVRGREGRARGPEADQERAAGRQVHQERAAGPEAGQDRTRGPEVGQEAEAVAEALLLYVLPQYSGLDSEQWAPLRDRLVRALTVAEGPDGGDRAGGRDGSAEALRRRFDAALRGIQGRGVT